MTSNAWEEPVAGVELARSLEEWKRGKHLVGVLKFKSITPLWPGGFNAATYHCSNDGNCMGPFYPDSKQLIGRTRWLARALHDEEAAAKLFGNTKNASPYQVVTRWNTECGGSPELIEWRVAKHYEELISLVKNTKYFNKHKKSYEKLHVHHGVSALSILGYRRLRRLLGINEDIRIGGKVGAALRAIETNINTDCRDNGFRRLLLLLTVPRFLIAVQGKDKAKDLYELQPLKPCQTLEVEVYRRPGVEPDKKRDDAVLAVLALTPIVAGLGKAVNRGFGRFTLENGDAPIVDKLRGLDTSNATDASQAISEALQDVKKLLNNDTGKSEHPGLHRIDPRSAIAAFTKLRHPFPYSIHEADQAILQRLPGTPGGKKVYCDDIGDRLDRVLCALSAIGAASTKTTWKAYHYYHVFRSKNYTYNFSKAKWSFVKKNGARLHTWPLGLPRSVGKRLEHTQGYILQVDKGIINNGIIVEVKERKKEKGRFQSIIHLWPHNDGYVVLSLAPSTHIEEFNERGLAELRRGEKEAVIFYLKHRSRHGNQYSEKPVSDRGMKALSPPGGQPRDNASQGVHAIDAAREWIRYLLG